MTKKSKPPIQTTDVDALLKRLRKIKDFTKAALAKAKKNGTEPVGVLSNPAGPEAADYIEYLLEVPLVARNLHSLSYEIEMDADKMAESKTFAGDIDPNISASAIMHDIADRIRTGGYSTLAPPAPIRVPAHAALLQAADDMLEEIYTQRLEDSVEKKVLTRLEYLVETEQARTPENDPADITSHWNTMDIKPPYDARLVTLTIAGDIRCGTFIANDKMPDQGVFTDEAGNLFAATLWVKMQDMVASLANIHQGVLP